jgi:release factor glutamine methyltransferase
VISFAMPPALARLAERGTLPFRRAILRRRVGRLVVEHVDGLAVVVLPDVFNPAIYRTSALLLHAIDAHVRPGMRVLDLGTGTGVAAVRAALCGARVTAVDINPDAVRCARINTLLNRVDDRVSVRHGDLFVPVSGERFDLLVCNPPFFREPPRDRRDLAWRSDTFLDRFCAGLDNALKHDGEALVVFSSHADESGLLDALRAARFVTARDRTLDFGSEVVTVHRVTRGARS